MKKVLVIDDDQDILDVMIIVLKSKGYDGHTSNNYDKAKDEISQFRPDIILMDVKLGGEDGRECCKNLTKDPSFNTPVILFSALRGLGNTYKRYGAIDCLQKPFDLKELYGLLNKYVSNN